MENKTVLVLCYYVGDVMLLSESENDLQGFLYTYLSHYSKELQRGGMCRENKKVLFASKRKDVTKDHIVKHLIFAKNLLLALFKLFVMNNNEIRLYV